MASTSPDSTRLRLAFVAAAVVAAAALVTAGGSAVGLDHAPTAARPAIAEVQPPVRTGAAPLVVGATGGKEPADRTVAAAKADIASMRSGRRIVDAELLRALAAPGDDLERPAGDRHDAPSGWCAPCHDPFRVGAVDDHGGAGKTRAAGTASAHHASPTGIRRAAQAGGGKTASSSADQSTSSVEPPAS